VAGTAWNEIYTRRLPRRSTPWRHPSGCSICYRLPLRIQYHLSITLLAARKTAVDFSHLKQRRVADGVSSWVQELCRISTSLNGRRQRRAWFLPSQAFFHISALPVSLSLGVERRITSTERRTTTYIIKRCAHFIWFAAVRACRPWRTAYGLLRGASCQQEQNGRLPHALLRCAFRRSLRRRRRKPSLSNTFKRAGGVPPAAPSAVAELHVSAGRVPTCADCRCWRAGMAFVSWRAVGVW